MSDEFNKDNNNETPKDTAAKKVSKKDSKKNKKKDGKRGDFVTNTYTTYRSEFSKIVWPSRQDLAKKTVTVVAISLLFGAYIAMLDGAFGAAFSALVGFLA